MRHLAPPVDPSPLDYRQVLIAQVATLRDPFPPQRQHYINVCAFIARFWHRGRIGGWAKACAIDLAYHSLECEEHDSSTCLWRTAVAQLFIFSGVEMFTVGNGAFGKYERKVGPLVEKAREACSTLSRWSFWVRRVKQSLTSPLLDEITVA